MTITSVSELPQGRTGKSTMSERSYVRVWRVVSNDPDDGPLKAGNAVGVLPGAFYISGNDSDPYAYAHELLVGLEDAASSRLVWLVTANYKTVSRKDPEDSQVNSPLSVPDKWSGGWQHFTEIAEKDIFNAEIVNSAGVIFDPPVEKDASRQILRAVVMRQTIDLAVLDDYQDAVNSDVFQGFSPGKVKVADISWEELHHPLVGFYYKISYEFHIKRSGWIKEILEQGRQGFGGRNPTLPPVGKLLQFTDDEGQPLSDPQKLDDQGLLLAQGATAVFKNVEVLEKRPFSLLI